METQTSSSVLVLFGQSLLIGLSIAAPVGQIGVLAIQRTLEQGRAAGLATGLGAALADAVYGAIGALAGGSSVSSPWAMVTGVLIGSAFWWVILSTSVARLRHRFDACWQRAVNRCSAALLAGLGLWQLGRLVT